MAVAGRGSRCATLNLRGDCLLSRIARHSPRVPARSHFEGRRRLLGPATWSWLGLCLSLTLVAPASLTRVAPAAAQEKERLGEDPQDPSAVVAGDVGSTLVPAADPAAVPPTEPADEPLDAPAESDPRLPVFEETPGFEEFGEFGEFESTDWDSVFAAFDSGFGRQGGPGLDPLFGVRYDKVEGLHLEGGVGVGPRWSWLRRVELRSGYDLGRERPHASARLALGPTERERFGVEFEIHDGIRSFGAHQPYGNTLFALVAGYDARPYLRDRGGSAGVWWKPFQTVTGRLGFVRFREDPARAHTTFHIFGPDRWMEDNLAAERLHANAIEVGLALRPRYSEDVALPGFYALFRARIHGGEWLQGDREYSTIEVRVDYLAELPWEDSVDLRLRYSLAAGRPPLQALPDLGGDAGLRAFEPRRFVGVESRLARVQYLWHEDFLRRTRIPHIKRGRLRLVPFAEIGSVWSNPDEQGGADPLRDLDDLRAPRASEAHWNLGFGLRRDVESSGLLSYVQVDFAWPMGAETGPVRVTLKLSSIGFD